MGINVRNRLFDKVFLLILGILLLGSEYESQSIVFVLLPILMNLLITLSGRPSLSFVGTACMLLLSFRWPEYLYFVPIFFYDGVAADKRIISLNSSFILVVLLFQKNEPITIKLAVGFFCLLAGYFAYSWLQNTAANDEILRLVKETQEKSFYLKVKNDTLLEQQETKIHLELSDERNRIARDIHDNVGHLLSSALLQTAAIKTINEQNQLNEPLEQLQTTITEGMNSIRKSVHNLHDESVSLSLACQNILRTFTFCPVVQSGEFPEYMAKEYKLACIMLIKEALANIMKHSNAEQVTIDFKNYPGFYKLTIADNGTKQTQTAPDKNGLGLIGMQERMEKIGGKLNYQQKATGFSLIAILPK
ncbi:sensor histidine kinase [Enterococcus sp. UD-01]|jgi:two-component system sensor histidine kinase DesK|uniref:sensor histidine kinase n=1 Tax=Enterococcus sp. UD-01 TaxID=3373911 RepID=UPI0038394CE4